MNTQHEWHKLIEQYTPNGAFGRLLIAILFGSIGVYSFTWSVAALITSSVLWLPLLLIGISLGAIILSLVMVWPVYLSLIGNVESTKSYTQANTTASVERDRDDSLAVVKRQYAAGYISEKEFEKRVENLLNTDAELHLEPERMSRRTEEKIRETD